MLEDAGGIAIQVRDGEGQNCHECGSAISTIGTIGTRIPTNVYVRT